MRRIGDGACDQYGVGRVADRGDRTEPPLRVHQAGVAFDGHAVHAQRCAAAGIESAVIFERGDGADSGIERALARTQQPQAGSGSLGAPIVIAAAAPGATVHKHGCSTVTESFDDCSHHLCPVRPQPR
jgi:hypothetical protein